MIPMQFTCFNVFAFFHKNCSLSFFFSAVPEALFIEWLCYLRNATGACFQPLNSEPILPAGATRYL
jgi:hypothetical protein